VFVETSGRGVVDPMPGSVEALIVLDPGDVSLERRQ
jgi:hypothetical protein